MEFMILPEDIQIKICAYSGAHELKKLMQTCNYMNHLISTNKKLMAKCCFVWHPKQEKDVIENSNRKYQKVRMNLAYKESRDICTVDLYQKFAPTLEDIEIRCDKFKASEIQLMLSHMQPSNMVQKARFKLVTYKRDVPFTQENIIAIESLKELTFDHSDCRILKHFIGMKLEKFGYSIYVSCGEHVSSVTSFLKTQHVLKHMSLNAGAIPNIFRKDVSEVFPFQLETLELKVNKLTEIQSANLNKFLKKQAKSLKSLNVIIQGGTFQSVITMLDRVLVPYIEVEFHHFNFDDEFMVGTLFNVTHLVIDTKEVPKEENLLALYLMKNVKELTLTDLEFNLDFFDALKSFKQLKKINFNQVTLKAFGQMPSVAEMHFDNMSFMHITNIVRFNKQISALNVGGQESIDAPYLKLILKRYKHIKQMNLSNVWIVEKDVLDGIFKYIGYVIVVLPKYLKKSVYVKNLPEAVARNLKYA